MALTEAIRPTQGFSRSVNLERDGVEALVLTNYTPTRRSLDAIGRVVEALGDPDQPRSWSLTGPYGSGKSAFALFLIGLLSARASANFATSFAVLEQASPALASALAEARARLGVGDSGFILAVATAQKEPVVLTLCRAVAAGVAAYAELPAQAGSTVKRLLRLAANGDSASFVSALREVTATAPVLLLVDEFGKNLEYASEQPHSGDLYVLQQVAESLAGSKGLPGCFFTFQHLSFVDYGDGLDDTRRKEWHKVQGRFEEVPFLESHDQIVQLPPLPR